MVEEPEVTEPSTGAEVIEDDNAVSSTAESETEADLLSVIQDAMQPEEETESHSESEVEEPDVFAAESNAESDEEVDEVEDFTDEPFHKHPRFKKVLEERNAYKDSADKFGVMQSYLTDNQLSGDEAAKGLEIMALMKANPMAALDALKPYVQNLSQAAGIVLPQDIQTRVDDGYLDEDAGRELAVSRASEQRANAQVNQYAEAQQQQVAQQHVNSLAQTVTAWEEKARQSDPDFNLKQEEIDDRIRVMVSERGRPNTPQDAISMAKEAYGAVNTRFQARFADRRPIKTASGGNIGGSPQAEPQSLQDAIANALGNS
tara:strand:+ start:2961 stop:3911 length:951 start_codon:yes stop_codon:yes gene_type:complete